MCIVRSIVVKCLGGGSLTLAVLSVDFFVEYDSNASSCPSWWIYKQTDWKGSTRNPEPGRTFYWFHARSRDWGDAIQLQRWQGPMSQGSTWSFLSSKYPTTSKGWILPCKHRSITGVFVAPPGVSPGHAVHGTMMRWEGGDIRSGKLVESLSRFWYRR